MDLLFSSTTDALSSAFSTLSLSHPPSLDLFSTVAPLAPPPTVPQRPTVTPLSQTKAFDPFADIVPVARGGVSGGKKKSTVAERAMDADVLSLGLGNGASFNAPTSSVLRPSHDPASRQASVPPPIAPFAQQLTTADIMALFTPVK